MAFPNGTCATAAALTIPSVTTLDITGGSDDPTAPCPSCAYDCDERHFVAWYTFVGTGERVILDTYDSTLDNNDTLLAVFSGTCENLLEVACSEDDETSPNGYLSRVEVDTVANTTYYVLLSNYYAEDAGSYVLTATAITLGAPYMVVVDGTRARCVDATGNSIWTYTDTRLSDPEDGGFYGTGYPSVAIVNDTVFLHAVDTAPQTIALVLDLATGDVLDTLTADASWPASAFWSVQFSLPTATGLAFRATSAKDDNDKVATWAGIIDPETLTYTSYEVGNGFEDARGTARNTNVEIDGVLYYLSNVRTLGGFDYYVPTAIRGINLTDGTQTSVLVNTYDLQQGYVSGGRGHFLDRTEAGQLLYTVLLEDGQGTFGGTEETAYVYLLETDGTIVDTWSYPFADLCPHRFVPVTATTCAVLHGPFADGLSAPPSVGTFDNATGTVTNLTPVGGSWFGTGWNSYSIAMVPSAELTVAALTGSACAATSGTYAINIAIATSGKSVPVMRGVLTAQDATPAAPALGQYHSKHRRIPR